MGCDIHLHVEVKLHGKWEHYAALSPGRNYEIFSKIAGVRGQERPLAAPRGLPTDVTALTAISSLGYGADGHTHTWLSSDEVKELNKWFDKTQQDEGPYYFESWVDAWLFGGAWDKASLPKAIEDFRWVCWFDS